MSGNTDAIRREYGNNQVELVYRSGEMLSGIKERFSAEGGNMPFDIVSDMQGKNGWRAVLEIPRDIKSAQVLSSIINNVDVVSYQELVPRMKDIFIKLVSNN